MPTIAIARRTWQDYGGEVSHMKVYTTPLTAANYVAQEGLVTALWAAVDAIALGGVLGNDHGNFFRDPNPVKPANEASQRETKWLVQYHDTVTGKKYTAEIPMADLSFLDPNDRDNAEIGDAGPVDAFVTAWNAVVRSEFDNPTLVDEISHVGRNI